MFEICLRRKINIKVFSTILGVRVLDSIREQSDRAFCLRAKISNGHQTVEPTHKPLELTLIRFFSIRDVAKDFVGFISLFSCKFNELNYQFFSFLMHTHLPQIV